MSEIGEGIAVAKLRLEKGKCMFCGKNHSFRKKDLIKPTKFKRRKVNGVGGRFVKEKLNMYPAGISPPSIDIYRSEGHHCLAFSSFILGAQANPPKPTDRFAALNYYLEKYNYDPNNKNNIIDLPGGKDKGDEDPEAHYVEFAKAVHHEKPLQLHIGGHADSFMRQSNLLLRNIVRTIRQKSLCSKPKYLFKDLLLERVRFAEDIAFKLTAGAISPWICHPAHLNRAEAFAKNKLNLTTDIKYPKL